MNSYHIINDTPYGFEFHEQTNSQLKAFERWFYQNKEHRLEELQEEYDRVIGGHLDFSVESLLNLGKFMHRDITTVPLSEEKYAAITEGLPEGIYVPDYDISIKSRSLVIDIAIYFGEVFLRSHPKLCWEQNKSKSDGRGFMDIRINDGLAPFLGPVGLILCVAWKVAKGTFTDDNLLKLYDIYDGKISENYR